MQIISWNIRKNNADNIPAERISGAVKEAIDLKKPWVLAILENTSGGDGVGGTLCGQLQGSWSRTVPAGGGTHTKENVVLVGGGCILKGHGVDTSWQAMFGGVHNLQYFSHVAQVEHRTSQSRTRPTTNARTVETARNEAPWDPSKCRNPVLIEVNDGSRDYKFGFVHSPGPQEGVSYSNQKYAQTYFTCIMESLQHRNLDGLLGDFNIYGSEPGRLDDGKLQDVSLDLGGTTFKKATDSVGDSRLDRAYLTSRFALHSKIGLVNGGKEASDHVGVSAELLSCGDRWHALVAAASSSSSELHLMDTEPDAMDTSDDGPGSDAMGMSDS